MLTYLFIFCVIVGTSVRGNEFSSTVDDTAVEDGKRQYTSLSRESQMPKFGSCWKNALNELNIGCKHLTDDTQSRLALGFTNCFLEKAGMETSACKPEQEISECVRFLDFKGYTTYTNFFTHTHSMCVFLQSQIWHEETGKVIGKLQENSVNVTRQLEQSQNLQVQLIKNQRKSLETQERLWHKGNELTHVLETSRENVRKVMYDFKSSTEEQREIILKIFDRIASLQSILLGEVTGFYSVLYNVIAAIAVYLITSTRRTRGARFWLFVILVANFAVERIIVATGNSGYDFMGHKEVESIIHSRQWLCRKLTALIAALVLAYEVYRYRDYDKINNALLVKILEENKEMKKFFIENRSFSDCHNSTLDDSFVREMNAIDDSNLVLSAEPSIPNITSTPIKKRLNTSNHSPCHSYNLRARKSIHNNSLLAEETPEQFCDYVNDLAVRSKEASKAVVRSLLRNPYSNSSNFSEAF